MNKTCMTCCNQEHGIFHHTVALTSSARCPSSILWNCGFFAVHKDQLAQCARTDDSVFVKTVSVLWTKEDPSSNGGDIGRKNRASNSEVVIQQRGWNCSGRACSVLGGHNSAQWVPLQTKFHMPQHLSWTDGIACLRRCFNLPSPPLTAAYFSTFLQSKTSIPITQWHFQNVNWRRVLSRHCL